MKKLLVTLFVACQAVIGWSQVSHELLATDFYYSPDTLYIAAGDTVNVTINGYHSVTEIDSLDWVNNIDNYNGGFDVGFGAATFETWFVIEDAGTYYYICEPHAAMGMKGVIIVDGTSEMSEHHNPQNFAVRLLNAGLIEVKYVDSNYLHVFDMSGKLVYEYRLNASSGKQLMENELPVGSYIFRFSKDNQQRVSTKAIFGDL